MTEGISLRTSTFGDISLKVDANGMTEMEVSSFSNTVKISLTPEEIGILLTKFGNACAKGRKLRNIGLASYNNKIEKRRKT